MTLTTHLIVHDDYSHIASALDSLYQTTTPALVDAVIVTINSGPDPAIDDLHQQFPEVTFKLNRQPQGFAVNHNRILALSKSAYVALLNDDVILHEAALDRLVEYLEAHPDTALVGPYLQDPDGTPQVASYSDPSLFRMLYKVSGLAHLTSAHSSVRS
jgi:GT2 family glycosyltransferase